MSEHTKGPWTSATAMAYKLAGPVGPMFQVEAFPGSPYWVAYVQDSPDGRGIANARLIAAAPELLEVLQQLLNELSTGVSISCLAKVEAAIAKAEGK